MIKIGLDVHGVIDAFPEKYINLVKAFDPNEVEIHIITGIKRELDNTHCLSIPCNECERLPYNYWFSIHQECEDRGVYIDFDHLGRPLVDPVIWDRMKAEYCEKVGIDFMFDDSPSYGEYFTGDAIYLQQKGNNPHREDWRHNNKKT